MFGSLTKWVAQVDDVERLPELVARAFRTATSGRPGPVVLALPEDMLVERADGRGRARRTRLRRRAPACTSSSSSAGCSRRPSGRSRSSAGSRGAQDAGGRLARWLEAGSIPVAAAWRCQDYVDNESRCYAGHLGLGQDPALTARLRDADALLVVGARLGDIETAGFTTIPPPGTGRTLIHVHPDPDELGRVYEPTLGVVSSGPRFAEALDTVEPLPRGAGDVDAAHAAFAATLEGRQLPGALQLTDAMAALRARLGPDAIVASGAGNFTVWAHRFYVFRRYRTQLAPLSGAMGTACRPRSRQSSSTPTATSSASPATGTS